MKLYLNKILPRKKDDIYVYLLMMVIILPIIYILFNEKITYMMLNTFLFVFFIAVLLFRIVISKRKKEKISLFKSKSFLILTLMYLCVFISTFFACNPAAAWFGVVDGFMSEVGIIQYLFYYFVAVCAIKMDKENLYYLLYFLLLISTIIIIIQFSLHNYNYIFIHRNHTGFYLSITTMVAVGLFLYSKNIKQALLFGLIMVLHFINLILNSSLSPLIGLLAFIVLGLIYVLIHRRAYLLRFGIVALSFLSLIAVFDYVPHIKNLKMEPETTVEKVVDVGIVVLNKIGAISDEEFQNIEVIGGSDGWGRLPMWEKCLQNMKEKPLFGVGVGCWTSYNPDVNFQTPHNEFLQYGAFAGIPCLALYLILILYMFIKFRKNHKNMSNISFLILGAILVYLIQSIFGSVMPFTAPLFYIILGFAINQIDINDGRKNNDYKI